MRLLRPKMKPAARGDRSGLTLIGPRADLPEEALEGHVGSTYKLIGEIGNFLTVDPGLGGTGWALWSRETFDALVPPIDSGVIQSKTHARPWWWHCSEIAQQLRSITNTRGVFVVYAELPKFMESAGKGLSAARDGDLVKLTTLFGAIQGACTNHLCAPFCPVPIVEWKGNLSKDILEARVRKKLPKWEPKTNTTHEMDAVGIGLFVKGHL